MIVLRLRKPRITARPAQNPSWRLRATRVTATIPTSATARQTSGTHHGASSGATSVNEQIAASTISITTIGISAVISTPTPGLSTGAERRNAAIRTPRPKLELKRLPR